MTPAPPPSPAPAANPPAVLTAWPRCAQLTTAFLLGVAAVLLGAQAFGYLQWGSRPTQGQPVTAPAPRTDLKGAVRTEWVPLNGAAGPAARPPDGAPDAKPVLGAKKIAQLTGPIDVNRASAAELQRLPGIGPKLSERIVEERLKGPFKSVEDLRRVSGIGPKTVERLRNYVCMGAVPDAPARAAD